MGMARVVVERGRDGKARVPHVQHGGRIAMRPYGFGDVVETNGGTRGAAMAWR